MVVGFIVVFKSHKEVMKWRRYVPPPLAYFDDLALLAVASQRYGEGKIDPKVLGKWLCAQEKNIAAGCKLMTDRTDKSRPKWYLELQGR